MVHFLIRKDRRRSTFAISKLKAFTKAMEKKQYGYAAAIAQNCDAISEEDRTRSLELSVVHRKRIALEWAYMLR